MTGHSRRQFINQSLAAASLASADSAYGQSPAASKTRLILLGTAGGPRPRKTRSAPAQVIIVNNAAYVVDCGNGVAFQMVRAGVQLNTIRGTFITHHHSDHNADYGNLLLLAWTAGLQRRVDTWGPPPLARMTELFFEMNAYDINMRIADEGRAALAPLVHPHELTAGGVVLEDENVTVKCALAEHPPITPAFAYRFDSRERSIVISGDTKPCEAVIRLAEGADVLVHEAVFPSAVGRLVAPLANAAALTRSILSHHSPIEEVGKVAQAAGVKTLVLSHFVPAEDESLTEQVWIEAAARFFKGKIICGRDLMEI